MWKLMAVAVAFSVSKDLAHVLPPIQDAGCTRVSTMERSLHWGGKEAGAGKAAGSTTHRGEK